MAWLPCYQFIHKHIYNIPPMNFGITYKLTHIIIFAGNRVRCMATFGSEEYGKSYITTHTHITTKCCVGALEWDSASLQTVYILMQKSWIVWDESLFVVCLFIECRDMRDEKREHESLWMNTQHQFQQTQTFLLFINTRTSKFCSAIIHTLKWCWCNRIL